MSTRGRAYALETEGLTVDFGALRAVDAVTMQVPVGQRRAIIGPNGAGKTTLFNLVAGQVRPTTGTVRIRGRDVTGATVPARARLGLGRTFQLTNLLPELTVAENVRLAIASGRSRARWNFWQSLERIGPVAAATTRLLREWELWPQRDAPVTALGHGRQRVLEIVMALAGEPRLLLLDEPTAGLTRREATLMTELTAALPADLTVLLIEHDMDVAFALADLVQVMHEGAVLTVGPPDEVQRDQRVIAAYLGDGRSARGSQRPGRGDPKPARSDPNGEET